jgi:hypothetical protein
MKTNLEIVVRAALLLALTSPSAANARTCSDAIAHCKQEGVRHSDAPEKCSAAGASCMRSGIFIGPFTGKVWPGVVKH